MHSSRCTVHVYVVNAAISSPPNAPLSTTSKRTHRPSIMAELSRTEPNLFHNTPTPGRCIDGTKLMAQSTHVFTTAQDLPPVSQFHPPALPLPHRPQIDCRTTIFIHQYTCLSYLVPNSLLQRRFDCSTLRKSFTDVSWNVSIAPPKVFTLLASMRPPQITLSG